MRWHRHGGRCVIGNKGEATQIAALCPNYRAGVSWRTSRINDRGRRGRTGNWRDRGPLVPPDLNTEAMTDTTGTERSDGWFAAVAIAITMSLLAAALGFVALVVVAGNGSPEVSAEGTAAGTAGSPQTVNIELGDLFVKPESIEVPAGAEVIVNVTNTGKMAHDLKLNGTKGIELLPPGESAKASLGIVSETSEAWCTVPGHKAAGMVLTINVGRENTRAGSGDAAANAGAKLDFDAEPGPDWQAYDPTLKPAPGGREHQVALEATERSSRWRRASLSNCGRSAARSPGRYCAAGSATSSRLP